MCSQEETERARSCCRCQLCLAPDAVWVLSTRKLQHHLEQLKLFLNCGSVPDSHATAASDCFKHLLSMHMHWKNKIYKWNNLSLNLAWNMIIIIIIEFKTIASYTIFHSILICTEFRIMNSEYWIILDFPLMTSCHKLKLVTRWPGDHEIWLMNSRLLLWIHISGFIYLWIHLRISKPHTNSYAD